MKETIQKMRSEWAAVDAKRDAGLTVPGGLVRHLDIPYGPYAENLLDIYYPEGSTDVLPTIVSIHGGGWFYGSKELYSHYCMRLALRGFTVVNFDYRLAPEYQYPAPLEDTCNVFRWMQTHAAAYRIDLDNLFTVGDSAGGQIEYQILTMLTNPAYAALFPFEVPEHFSIRGCGMNCGCYFLPFSRLLSPKMMGPLFQAYFPEDYLPILPQLKTAKYVTADYPPAFVMSAQNDYLKFMAKPLHKLLKRKGAQSILKIYGTKEQKEIGHVFHLNCRSALADQCNDEQCAFFRTHMRGCSYDKN